MKTEEKRGKEMTVREAFIMAAMQGLCASGDARSMGVDWVSEIAVRVADKTISKMRGD